MLSAINCQGGKKMLNLDLHAQIRYNCNRMVGLAVRSPEGLRDYG
jgi:hypothetical protein